MTLPTERYRAVVQTEDLLKRLAFDESVYSRAELREICRALLRHYPTGADLDQCPEAVFRVPD